MNCLMGDDKAVIQYYLCVNLFNTLSEKSKNFQLDVIDLEHLKEKNRISFRL